MIRTSIWKANVPDRRWVGRLNVAGDEQADLVGHGGEHRAVYVYDLSAYRHWERALGRTDFVLGQFGENFTVEGLPDDHVCVGDRFRIGEASFEVTQPRVTCHKLGVRMGEPQMPALLYAHGLPGFYLRVLEEGELRAGDRIERIAPGPETMTVRESARCCTCRAIRRTGCVAPSGSRPSQRAVGVRSRRCSSPSQRATAVSARPIADRLLGPASGAFASLRPHTRRRRSSRSNSNRRTGSHSRDSGPGSSSRCGCSSPPAQRSAVTRCRPRRTGGVTGSASSASPAER